MGDAWRRPGARRGRRGDAAARARRGARRDRRRDRSAHLDPAAHRSRSSTVAGTASATTSTSCAPRPSSRGRRLTWEQLRAERRPRAALVDARRARGGERETSCSRRGDCPSSSPTCSPRGRRGHRSTPASDGRPARLDAMTAISGLDDDIEVDPRRRARPVPALRRRLLVGLRARTTASPPSSTTRWPRAAGSASPSPSATAAAARASARRRPCSRRSPRRARA